MKTKKVFNRGLILIYPGFQNDAKLYQYNRIIEEFKKLGITVDKLKVDDVFISIKDGKPNLKVNEYDFCIQLVKDKYINELLCKNKIRSFNTYSAIDNCDDKMMTYTILANHKVRMPFTISGVRNMGVENITDKSVSEKFKDSIEENLGYPLIAKKSNSKGGRDIHKINNKSDLNNICDALDRNQYLFQEFVSTNVGKDIRVVVVGGKVVGSFMRVNEKDFRSNISLGGKAVPYEVTEKYKRVAEKVAKILKLDYCSVDFFLVEDEESLICEVNADPALCDIEELTGKNVAEIYAKYIVDKVY